MSTWPELIFAWQPKKSWLSTGPLSLHHHPQFCQSGFTSPKHQNVRKVAAGPVVIVHVKDVQFSYPSSTLANNDDSSVHAINYMPNSARLKQMVVHVAAKYNDKEKLQNDWRENGQVPAKAMTHRLAFLEMLKKIKSNWGRLLGRINVSKHQDLLSDKVRPVHSATYHVGHIGRPFSEAEINR